MQTMNKNRNPYLTNRELLIYLQHSNSANPSKKSSKKCRWTPLEGTKQYFCFVPFFICPVTLIIKGFLLIYVLKLRVRTFFENQGFYPSISEGFELI